MVPLPTARTRPGLAAGSHFSRVVLSIGLALCVFAASACSSGSGKPSSGGATGSSSGAQTGYMSGATYFGHASPGNFWSSDLSQAPHDFQRIKGDGFNTVALVLPWGQFEPGVNPSRFDDATFSRLLTLIREAGDAGLTVILRLGYAHDINPEDQLPYGGRFQSLFTDQGVYQSWLDYVNEVHRRVAALHNVRSAFITWEDLWPYVEAVEGGADTAARLQYAKATGFQTWLSQNHSLADINRLYGQRFASFDEVPIPTRHNQAFGLVFEYFQWMLVHKFFEPAAQRYPGLTMETRVDQDPIYDGQRSVGAFTYSDLYQLPGSTVTGMYWSPYMGTTVTSGEETADQALQALRNVLTLMKSRSGDRSLAIYEYEIVSNAAQIAGTPTIAASELPTFVKESAPVLEQLTSGYLLWTYRDFNLSVIYNPSFALGLAGWQAQGTTSLTKAPDGESAIHLPPASTVTQSVPPSLTLSSSAGMVTVSFRAAATSATAQISITVGGGSHQTVSVGSSWKSYSVRVPSSGLASSDLSFAASGDVSLTNVEEYNFTQLGSVYSSDWTPESAQPALQQMNAALTRNTP